MEPFLEPLKSCSQKYPQNLSIIEVELFSVNIKLLLRGSILGSKFYIFVKFKLSVFTVKKINVIAIQKILWVLVNLRIVKTWFLELWSSIFRSKNQSAPALFWKILLGHFIFGYKNEFLSNQSNFWFQMILIVSLIGFSANIKNGAQNGAPL